MKSTFTPKEVVKLIGISYRQIQYWDKTSFIRPSYRSHGKYRQYTFSDLMQMRIAKMLRDRDFSIQRLRKTIKLVRDLIPRINFPLSECNLLIEGEKILVFNGDVLMDPGTRENFMQFDARMLRQEIDETFPEEDERVGSQSRQRALG